MKKAKLLLASIVLGLAGTAHADLTPFEDYDIGETITNVTTVKVDSNMIDKYLEGLSKTWKPANDVAVELGQMASYSIYVSQMPNGGDFNVILVQRYDDLSQLEPSKAEFDKFMEAWGDANQAMTDEVVQTYPDIRTITGEYLIREITLK